MKKGYIIVFVIICLISALFSYMYYFSVPRFSKISVSESTEFTKEVKISFKNNLHKTIDCGVNKDGEEYTKWVSVSEESCSFEVENGKYNFYVKYKDSIIYSDSLDFKINKIIDLKLSEEKMYVLLGEEKRVEYSIEKIGEPLSSVKMESEDTSVFNVIDGVIKPVSDGRARLIVTTSNGISKSAEVIVTSLVKPSSLENNKVRLTCGRYSTEEAHLIDEVLEYKINEAGYKTRGAVVAAARFLVLNFPYKVTYFGENGRLTGAKKADGEGRYYKKGLYLSTDKYNDILYSISGPAIWGCPLLQVIEEPYEVYSNGLDCSGFVTWALFNAGFDVGDIGAGNTYSTNEVYDLGVHHDLTRDFVYNGDYKVGDLIGTDGHAAIIAGLDEEHIYIAESLLNGVVIETFRKDSNELYTLYSYINTMDEVYLEEGNYTDMW